MDRRLQGKVAIITGETALVSGRRSPVYAQNIPSAKPSPRSHAGGNQGVPGWRIRRSSGASPTNSLKKEIHYSGYALNPRAN
ncbi:hypothetical protein [Scytonema sp. PRP1]|uniref:hypothetical protein n=1 Tax=Scytonema sp. PRP1 TaxID=3120513 RepID=UPI002FCE893C